jgi:Protein of unknown function (DUF3433)
VSADAFSALFISASPDVPFYTYMDPQSLITASQRTFKFLAAQMAHQILMSPTQNVIEGSYSDRVDRIMVQELPLRVMQGLMAAAALLTIVVGLLMPRCGLPGSANTIGFYISVCRRSQPAMKPLEGSEVYTKDRMRQILSFYRFHTDFDKVGKRPEGRINSTISPANERIFSASKSSDWQLSQKKWWRPFAFSLPAMLLTLLTPLIFISVLEVLLQYSHTHQGLVEIELGSRYRYTWLFGPTLLLVLIATLFNILDFEIEKIHPFRRLRRPAATAKSSILNNPLSKLTPVVLWDAFWLKDIALGVTAFAVILAPFLPIVGSGLYAIQNAGSHQKVHVQQTDWFQNLSQSNQEYDMRLAITPVLITQQNLIYPQWTYDELVLPKVNVVSLEPNAKVESLQNGTSLVIRVPALRGAMNCSRLEESRINKTRTGYFKNEFYEMIEFGVNLSPNCTTRDGDGEMTDSMQWSGTNGYFGHTIRLKDESRSQKYPDPCEDFQYLLPFGYVEDKQTKAFQFLLCYPYTQQLDVDLTLTLPSYSVSPALPPVAIESSARFFSNDSFELSNIPSLAGGEKFVLENFFQILMYGKDGIPGNELLGNTTRLIEGVEHLYRVFAAQAYNKAYRGPFRSDSNSNESSILDATLFSPYRSRLVQFDISTRILQGLLAALFICAVVAYAILWKSTGGTRRILPHDPGSIAMIASLLAGSEILTMNKLNIPPGMASMSNKEMEKSGVFDGWIYSLGWWDTDEHGGKRYGIDVGQAGQERDETA